MNYRNSVSENIPSLESIFVDYLAADSSTPISGGIPSNRKTIYYLLFNQEVLPTNADEKTLLENSILKDSYLNNLYRLDLTDEKQYEEPLLYYIIHKNEPFPLNSKYSQFLSNIFQKNFTGKGQPPQVRTILCSIDYEKLSGHIDSLIQNQQNNIIDINKSLINYITRLVQSEPRLVEISGITDSKCIADALAWILMYALLDDTSFESYCKSNSASSERNISVQIPDIEEQNTISLSYQQKRDSINTLAEKCRKTNLYCKVATYILLTITTIQLVCFVIPFFTTDSEHLADQKLLLFCIAMLIVGVLLLTLRYIPYYLARQVANYSVELFNVESDCVPVLPLSEYQKRNGSRSVNQDKYTNKKISISILLVLWMISILTSILTGSLPILLAGLLISFALYLYCDHFLNYILENRNYKNHFIPKECHKNYSNFDILAQRFMWDYDSSTDSIIHKHIPVTQEHSESCIRYIFYGHTERQNYLWMSYTIFSLILNLFVLLVGIIQFILPCNFYFEITNPKHFSIFCLGWIIVSDIIYITLLLQTSRYYHTYAEYMNYSFNPNINESYLQKAFCQAYQTGIISNIDISRGIFHYNCSKWEQNIKSTDLFPLDDRELVIHRYYDKLERFTIAGIAILLAYICIVVWHFHIIHAIWAIPVLLLFYPLFAAYLLPKMDQCFIKGCIKRYLASHGESQLEGATQQS